MRERPRDESVRDTSMSEIETETERTDMRCLHSGVMWWRRTIIGGRDSVHARK